MTVRLGISLLDIVPQTSGLALQAPDRIVEKIGVLTVLDHRSTTSDNHHLHQGLLQSAADALHLDTERWPVRIPGLTHGLPFRLAVARQPAGAGLQEPAPLSWTLDIDVRHIEITLLGLRAAEQTGGSDVLPLTLKPKAASGATPSATDATPVKLVGRCVVRISKTVDAPVAVQLADVPDPLDPNAPTGLVARLDVQPPSFYFGSSLFGMTLRSVVLDQSSTFTPAAIVARGHDERWQGLQIQEATFFCPPSTPLLRNLSLGVRDVIVGTPGGLQGELRVEFGAAGTDAGRVVLEKFVEPGPWTALPATLDFPAAATLSCPLTGAGADGRLQVRAPFDLGTDNGLVGVWWKLPAGGDGTELQTPAFMAKAGETLRYRLRKGSAAAPAARPAAASQVPEGQTELLEVMVRFTAHSAVPPAATAPLIDATVGGVMLHNVVHLRGTLADLQGLRLRTRDGSGVGWTLGTGTNVAASSRGADFVVPRLAAGTETIDLVLDNAGVKRRLRLDVVPDGPLAVGHQLSVDPASRGTVTLPGKGSGVPSAVQQTFTAAAFHDRGQRDITASAASLQAEQVVVPTGLVAQVSVPLPGPQDPLPPTPPPAKLQNLAQVLFSLDEPRASGVAARDVVFPYDGSATDSRHETIAWPLALGQDVRDRPLVEAGAAQQHGAEALLAAWVRRMQKQDATAAFYLVGRTDDLWAGATKSANYQENAKLAALRIAWVRRALVAAGVSAARINERWEMAPKPANAAWPTSPPRIGFEDRLALNAATVQPRDAEAAPVWNSRWTPRPPPAVSYSQLADDPVRFPYRCVEVLAALAPSSPVPAGPPAVIVPMLVPGPDGVPKPPPPATADTQPVDHRVRLRALWDSPTALSSADAVPTLVEALVAWKSSAITVPAPGASGPGITVPKPAGADFWEVLLRWVYDARSGQTEATGALSLPDGALRLEGDGIAGALALGPALGALAQRVGTDPAGRFVLATSMLGVGAGVGVLLNAGSSGKHGWVDIDRFAIAYRWDGASHASARVDYTVALVVDVAAGADELMGSIRLRYKGVGLRFDGASGALLDRLSLSYDDLSVEVVDTSPWTLSGPLGELVRIAAARMGSGSQWLEFDLEFALDLGVVRLDGATIRVALGAPPALELRGLKASVDIPQALIGQGAVSVADGGAIRAMVALTIVPAKLGAFGALAMDRDFTSIEVGVQLPVGIPLGGTGLGIFGFMGRFVANGSRNVAVDGDPVRRQLAWYVLPPEAKYIRQSGQYAFGVGLVIGTLADGAFTFNAEGALSIGFPDLSVVLGVKAALLKQRKAGATAQGQASGSVGMVGLVLIEPDSVLVALRVSLEIPKILKVNMPLSAYFPLANSGPWFIRIGTDNHPSRPGDPVTIVLLPGLLDLRAWAFLMVEERGIEGLGGTLIPRDLATPLDFQGFALGMGAGFDLKLTEGLFTVELSAFIVAGLGTKPRLLAGIAGARGELSLGPLSAGVDGRIEFHVSETSAYVDAHFCAHADLGLFVLSGCVGLHLGDPRPTQVAVPPSPFAGLDLCDHKSAIKGRAARLPADAVPVVWPDTVAVLRCSHCVDDGFDSADFIRRLPPAAALSHWTGSTELKYAYRLSALTLWRLTGSNPGNPTDWTRVPGPFDAVWWLPSHRRAVIEGLGGPLPSTEEGRELGLFSVDPRAWSRWLDPAAVDVPGDPAGTLESVCTPSGWLNAACAFGADLRAGQPGWVAACDALPNPGRTASTRFALRCALSAALDAGTLAALGGDALWSWVPGAVAPLQGTESAGGRVVDTGWRFPGWRSRGAAVATAPMALFPSQPLAEATLVLQACTEQGAVSTVPAGVCDSMPPQDGRLAQFEGANTGFLYEGNDMEALADRGRRAIRVDGGSAFNGWRPASAGLVDVVTVDLRLPRFGVVTFTALSGRFGLPMAATTRPGIGAMKLSVSARGLRGLLLAATADVIVYEVCWGAPTPGILDLIEFRPLAEPQVTAFRADGSAQAVVGSAVPKPPAEPRCTTFTYVLPDGPWSRIEVAPWLGGDLRLVSLCGVSSEVVATELADSRFRGAAIGLMATLAQHAVQGTPTRQVRLAADASYEIRAGWQWQHFVPNRPGDTPGPPDGAAWKDGGTDSFRFRTARFGVQPAPQAAENTSLDVDPAQGGPGFDERTFDPRGLARYVTRAVPSHEDPPHFLADRVGFWFMVDHLQSLLEAFGRVLQVKVLRTLPEPGALVGLPPHLPGQRHVLDVTRGTAWKIDILPWHAADFRLREAALAAPCIGSAPALGSASVAVDADLVPGSEYDLLLNVAPATVGAEAEVVVARSHFRTSRYRDAGALLAALGFPAAVGLVVPHDTVAAAAMPPGPLDVGDAALDAALATLGMDPWPLSAQPRSTLVWLVPAAPGAPWRLAGVLLEADEPVWRPGLATGAHGEAPPPLRMGLQSLQAWRWVAPAVPGGTSVRLAAGTLDERVRNAAGTRVLWVPAAPFAFGEGQSFELTLQLVENGAVSMSGITTVFDRPLSVLQDL